ncbi:EAL domain-containing protein [Alteromonas gilva]|uniref:EAL domain-containing protein n=1 Tax=Alteromonas gilva TaxID=2987522 RepID=A0ABT5L8H0_9ALTE|nr:EAL domain-containing protein [Alteromonas gilva]MDC8832871.1 EAL domain-containing protein [Alteromonas gilva]
MRKSERAFQFAHQPIVKVNSGSVVAHELLLREYEGKDTEAFLNDSNLFLEHLVGLAESKALTLKALMMNGGVKTLFVNFTPDQISSQLFVRALNTFYENGIAPSTVAIEVTEHIDPSDKERFYNHLGYARRNGHPIVVDDFGCGISNFQHVTTIRPSIVKTDKELIQSAARDPWHKKALKALVRYIHDMEARVIIEGVETEEQFNVAQFCDADFAQGYYFAKPELSKIDCPNIIDMMQARQFKLAVVNSDNI